MYENDKCGHRHRHRVETDDGLRTCKAASKDIGKERRYANRSRASAQTGSQREKERKNHEWRERESYAIPTYKQT